MSNYQSYLKKIDAEDPDFKKGVEFETWLLEMGFNIAEMRNKKGYSQKVFAEKLGISQSAVARIESGQNMKCSTLWLISDVLETDLVVFGASKVDEENKVSHFFGLQLEGKIVGTTSTAAAADFYQNSINTPFKFNTPSYVQ